MINCYLCAVSHWVARPTHPESYCHGRSITTSLKVDESSGSFCESAGATHSNPTKANLIVKRIILKIGIEAVEVLQKDTPFPVGPLARPIPGARAACRPCSASESSSSTAASPARWLCASPWVCFARKSSLLFTFSELCFRIFDVVVM